MSREGFLVVAGQSCPTCADLHAAVQGADVHHFEQNPVLAGAPCPTDTDERAAVCRERTCAEERLEKRRRAEALSDSTTLTVRLTELRWTLRVSPTAASAAGGSRDDSALLEAVIAQAVFVRTINRDRTGALPFSMRILTEMRACVAANA